MQLVGLAEADVSACARPGERHPAVSVMVHEHSELTSSW